MRSLTVFILNFAKLFVINTAESLAISIDLSRRENFRFQKRCKSNALKYVALVSTFFMINNLSDIELCEITARESSPRELQLRLNYFLSRTRLWLCKYVIVVVIIVVGISRVVNQMILIFQTSSFVVKITYHSTITHLMSTFDERARFLRRDFSINITNSWK